MNTQELLRGLILVVVSVLLCVATLGIWLGNMPSQPLLSWVVFVVGFAICAVLAISGIWGILGAFKDKEEH